MRAMRRHSCSRSSQHGARSRGWHHTLDRRSAALLHIQIVAGVRRAQSGYANAPITLGGQGGLLLQERSLDGTTSAGHLAHCWRRLGPRGRASNGGEPPHGEALHHERHTARRGSQPNRTGCDLLRLWTPEDGRVASCNDAASVPTAKAGTDAVTQHPPGLNSRAAIQSAGKPVRRLILREPGRRHVPRSG